MFEIGKHRARKDEQKLKHTVQQMKLKFSSKACSSINCSWTKFYWFTRLAKPKQAKHDFMKKLSQEQIQEIQNHMESDNITFPLPDTKHAGKRFFRMSIMCAQKMYNVLSSCTQKISLSMYYKYCKE